jgi:glucose/arabinose dehydrogenase
VAEGLESPSYLTHAGDGSGRLFVTEKRGRVRIIDADGDLLGPPFLDITDRVSEDSTGASERGLLSIAFPPGGGAKTHLYAYYTARDGALTISRFGIEPDDPDRADPGSEEIIASIPHARSNHNGGQLAFGPDGWLYAATGDGGGGGDPDGNGQNPATLLGKLLRFDVEGGPGPYPADIVAVGLRNPWRFSFDGTTLYIADVGQASTEEINRAEHPFPPGLNFGWNVMEGSACYQAASCDTAGLTLPIVEYSSAGPGHCAVVGGYVYRGAAIPSLVGSYVYADYCSATVWGLGEEPLQAPSPPSSFGLDEQGELYIVGLGGVIYRIEGLSFPFRVVVPLVTSQ